MEMMMCRFNWHSSRESTVFSMIARLKHTLTKKSELMQFRIVALYRQSRHTHRVHCNKGDQSS